ncbi:hypothetical protein DICSQDRAFT_139572 [Dichomitus squalens LYAD-421 SS1]|uniref:Uncharacterized protein n=1 Tax=Dichomitus squalens (strain LYAD-421) TaxID=732165 RepID=R7SR59_DICSQ|nr:uncharacterized protein DICSQDRAFT_139572 [Dichomitus squalens LYAD-421 SS1]EJF58220.1 hypothetical protein DICSQDRAFT_139572 [Dichomitus squalens LYAD-421 SS1]
MLSRTRELLDRAKERVAMLEVNISNFEQGESTAQRGRQTELERMSWQRSENYITLSKTAGGLWFRKVSLIQIHGP